MKKYEANGLDEFGWHVDVNSTGSMNRWLAFFCYLSDNDEGHTSFPYQKVTTDCKKGTIVVFHQCALVASRCKTCERTKVFFRKLFTLCRLKINTFS